MIAVIDYGVGNLRSVEKALQFIGCEAYITSDINLIKSSQAVILPGVGAYKDAMESLKKSGLDEIIKECIHESKPFLGICLGFQLLYDYSEEGSYVEGLGILKGAVKRFPDDADLKVPHMGWNCLKNIRGSLFEGLNNPYVYFVHSYYPDAIDRDTVTAITNYGIVADVAIESKNIFATQFHPEKSGAVGLAILRNWVKLFDDEDCKSRAQGGL